MSTALYYVGRIAQLIGMWMLLVDLFTAGPLGPDPRLFAAGVGVFLAGWALVRSRRENRVPRNGGHESRPR
jgi:hypothetical protein